MKRREDVLDLIAILKTYNLAKTHVKRMKIQTIEWEKIFANLLSDKKLVPRIQKELSKLNRKNVVRNWAKEPQTFH